MPKIFLYLSLLIGIFLIFITIFSFASKKNNQSQINNVQEEKEEEEIKEEKKEEIKPEEIKNEENNLIGETTFLKVLFIIGTIVNVISFMKSVYFLKKSCSSLSKNKNRAIIQNFLAIIVYILWEIISFLIRKEKKPVIILFVIHILALCMFFLKYCKCCSQVKKMKITNVEINEKYDNN